MPIDPFVSRVLARSSLVHVRNDQVLAVAWPVDHKHVISSASSFAGHSVGDTITLCSGISGARRSIRAKISEMAPKDLDFVVLTLLDEIPDLVPLYTFQQRNFHGPHILASVNDKLAELANPIIHEIDVIGETPGLITYRLDMPDEPRVLPGAMIFNPKYQSAVGMNVLPNRAREAHEHFLLPWGDAVRSSGILRGQFTGTGPERLIEEIIGEPARVPPSEPTANASSASTRSSSPFHYPFASFHRVSTGVDEEIPANMPLSPPADGAYMEFRFGFSNIQLRGIPQDKQHEPPEFKPPVGYPIEIDLEVWSQDLSFEKSADHLTLVAVDRESVSSFRLKRPPFAPEKKFASLFVFVRYQTHLIAVFRIDAELAETATAASGPVQHMAHAYLDHHWFNFEKSALTAPVVTIYFRAQGEKLDVFAFYADKPVWARVGPDSAQLFQQTKDIYLAVTGVAKQVEKQETVTFNDAAFRFSHSATIFFPIFFILRLRRNPEPSPNGFAVCRAVLKSTSRPTCTRKSWFFRGALFTTATLPKTNSRELWKRTGSGDTVSNSRSGPVRKVRRTQSRHWHPWSWATCTSCPRPRR